jgi:hypothetical protein
MRLPWPWEEGLEPIRELVEKGDET